MNLTIKNPLISTTNTPDNNGPKKPRSNASVYKRLLTTGLILANLSVQATIRIHCIGDSITEGVISTGVIYPGGYRNALSKTLSNRLISHEFVGTSTTSPPHRHNGHGGFAFVGIFNRSNVRIRWGGMDGLPTWLSQVGAVDIAVVMYGLNDLEVFEQDRDWYPMVLSERARTMARAIHAARPSAWVILCEITPYRTPGHEGAKEGHRLAFNASLSALALDLRAEGVDATVCRTSEGITPSMFGDRLHLLPIGQDHLGATIAATIADRYPIRGLMVKIKKLTGGTK